jgi:hypothetical protein
VDSGAWSGCGGSGDGSAGAGGAGIQIAAHSRLVVGVNVFEPDGELLLFPVDLLGRQLG